MSLPSACLFALAAIAAGLAGCASHETYTVGGGEPASQRANGPVTRSMTVESKPIGATISVNGAEEGNSPIRVTLKLDRDGRLLENLDVSADYSIVNPIRGTSHVVATTLRRGEVPPPELLLARPADGGIQRLGRVVPGM